MQNDKELTPRIDTLKGQCHEISDYGFDFFSFPQAIPNFSENSRSYSLLKVHHRRWQKEKIFNLNNFEIFFITFG